MRNFIIETFHCVAALAAIQSYAEYIEGAPRT
jgi:predicted naringenin-chalcone synthase